MGYTKRIQIPNARNRRSLTTEAVLRITRRGGCVGPVPKRTEILAELQVRADASSRFDRIRQELDAERDGGPEGIASLSLDTAPSDTAAAVYLLADALHHGSPDTLGAALLTDAMTHLWTRYAALETPPNPVLHPRSLAPHLARSGRT
jgi:hypothetical protein